MCAGATRQLPGATDDSKIDIAIGLAPPPNTVVVGINDTINIKTPGLAPPPGNLVSINTNNTVTLPVPQLPARPPVGILAANAKATDAAIDDSKIDIGIGLAPPNTGVIGINDTINIKTPGLAPPPGNLVSIETNNTVTVPLPNLPVPPPATLPIAIP